MQRNAMQCNGNALVQRDRKRHWGEMLASNSLLSSLSSHLSLALLFSSDAIADVPSSIPISLQNSLSPFRPPLISFHLLSIPTQILRASQNSRVTIDLCLNLFNFHLFNIEFHFFSIFYQKKIKC